MSKLSHVVIIFLFLSSLFFQPFAAHAHADHHENLEAHTAIESDDDGSEDEVSESDDGSDCRCEVKETSSLATSHDELAYLSQDELSGHEDQRDLPINSYREKRSFLQVLSHVSSSIEGAAIMLRDGMKAVLFFNVSPVEDYYLPAIIFWLILASVFFTLRLKFVNFTMFAHGIQLARGKYTNPDAPGEVTHSQALMAAVSATVGMGNVAGVAIAVSKGGPGAVFWMVVAGLLGMAAKFAEVVLALRYRKVAKDGTVSGGAFHYLKEGLEEMNMPRFGKFLAITFAVCCILGSFGGGNMFQSNQSVMMLGGVLGNVLGNPTFTEQYGWIIALIMTITVAIVLIGGIKRISAVAEAIVPFMTGLFVISSVVVLIIEYKNVIPGMVLIIRDAFTGEAVTGGMLGALLVGFHRAAVSNESGIGSAPIAHAAAKTNEPVSEACVAILEPFISTVCICFVTGLVITVTGTYADPTVESGILMSIKAFEVVASWYPLILCTAVVLFAYSTIMTWSYYGERAWHYVFGHKTVVFYHVVYCAAIFLGGIYELSLVLDLSDMLMFIMAVPNVIGLYILSGKVSREYAAYKHKLKTGYLDEHGA